MSRHEVVHEPYTFVFGWDQMLQSFFLQVHDGGLTEEENPFIWVGADQHTKMYEVEDLMRELEQRHLRLDPKWWAILYRDKDDGV